MVLSIHSDAIYLSETNTRSRVGGYLLLSKDDPVPHNNGSILIVSQIIKKIMSSTAEVDLGDRYINAHEAIYIRQILEALGHP